MMVQQLKEDQAGKSEEELSECFRVFDKYVTCMSVPNEIEHQCQEKSILSFMSTVGRHEKWLGIDKWDVHI